MIFSAIAVALVKVAFFPDVQAKDEPTTPTASIAEQVTTASIGSIVNTVEVAGSVVADDAVQAKATLAGEVLEVFVAVGQQVELDAPIATIRQDIPVEPVAGVDAEGNPTLTQPKPIYKTATVTAPVSGTVSSVPVVVAQVLAVGDLVANVAPPSFSVTGSIRPEDQFRLIEQPLDAQVTVVGGPAAFTCTGLTITSPLSGSESGAGQTDPGSAPDAGGASGPVVRCHVPADVRVFAGLTATITLPGGSAENVLVLPATAVKGNSASGSVWVLGAEGQKEERPVTLGLSDGTNVEIVEGVTEDDQVLQFIPVDDPSDEPGQGCIEQPDGSMYCDEAGFAG
ncbi:efflux RND transporter periplasmic adaptor subunit [Okibacterium endophyticum]